jgi:BirA family biotin operon repressor/biotin-[acetyl-CoA-carboxylase] ligase
LKFEILDLKSEIQNLDADKIKTNLNTKRIGRQVFVYEHTTSTQTIARQYAAVQNHDGLVFFAEEQSAGAGRPGKSWHSGRADSILCSILLERNRLNTELLSISLAVAVAEAIGSSTDSRVQVKWPNDIMLNGKKLAGILLETVRTSEASTNSHQPSTDDYCIIGIGINCHQQKEDFPAELAPLATSIDIESHSIVDRNLLARRLIISLDHWLAAAENNPRQVTERWRQLSIQLGHRVTLVSNGHKFSGTCTGIDPETGLIVHLDTGAVRLFDAVHTTIVK